MASADLQQNTPNTTWSRQAYIAGRAQLSIRFRVDTAGFVQRVGWWQTDAADVRPTKIGVYAAGVLVWSNVAVTEDAGVPGWQWNTVPIKVELQPGTTYAVGIDTPNPGGSTVGAPADRFDPPAPFIWDDGMSHTQTLPMPTYPSVIRLDQTIGLNVTWEDLSHVDNSPPTGQANLAQELSRWFDDAIADKPDGVPGLYPMAAAELLVVPAGGATKMLPRILATALSIIGGIADLATAIEIVRGWLDPAPGGTGSAVRRVDGTTVLDDTQALIAGQVSLEAQLNTLQAGVTALLDAQADAQGAIGAFPVGWTLLAEDGWVGSIALEEPAHLYVVNVTTPPAHGGHLETAAGLWLPRLGWWTEINGSQAGARGFLEFGTQQLHAGGRAMAGCALVAKPDAAGTIQAWGAP